MTKPLQYILLLLVLLTSCQENINEDTDPVSVFEVAWKTLDKKYCFFKEKSVNWQAMHDKYASRIDEKTSSDSLFKVIGEMICELRDGHVNLYSASDVIRYWKWFEDYPPNFSEPLQDIYLGKNYKISGGLKYLMLSDSIGYIAYGSFSSGISNSGLDYILSYFSKCRGIIIDVRNNSGGSLSNVGKIACRFTDKTFISGYISHKTGPGHSDFSELYPMEITPSDRIRSDKKVVILTNRMCYSATNAFVCTMKQLPNITVIGDKTGGGGGFPTNYELPNGWILRFSSCTLYDQNKGLTENGIEPNYYVNLLTTDTSRNLDTIIEAARYFLKTGSIAGFETGRSKRN